MEQNEQDIYGILKRHWGYDGFRGVQEKIIRSILSGRDTIGLMPTGGGKSVTFQVPALALSGVCIVITPLVALIKDQVDNLQKLHIRATALTGSITRNQVVNVLDNCVNGGCKLLYIAPERIQSSLFQNKLRHMRVSFFAIDEAHCVSQWGHDFRPSYLNIPMLRTLKPGVPMLALTATATERTLEDMVSCLDLHSPAVFKMSFERHNLSYIVRQTEDKFQETLHILSCTDGSAIVYTFSRNKTKEVADRLNHEGVPATFYHAGLTHKDREQRQNLWQSGKVRVMVATNAFGMGIDKADVRLVIHVDCPSTLEAYFQEAGRAGRDQQPAFCVLLFSGSDVQTLRRRVSEHFPERAYIADIYEHLAYYAQVAMGFGRGHRFEFNIEEFCKAFKFFPITVLSALRLLTNAGYIEYKDDADNLSRVKFILSRDDLYSLDNGDKTESELVTFLLRNYTGLFVDYSFIDESWIALALDKSRDEVYKTLKSLVLRGVISFIPRKSVPVITYLTDRLEKEELRFSADIYDIRRSQYKEKLEAVIAYAKAESVCRSRLLLKYFGEKNRHDCGHCDVCRANGLKKDDGELVKVAMKAIVEMLKDNEEHPIGDIRGIEIETGVLDEALHRLVDEGRVLVRADKIALLR